MRTRIGVDTGGTFTDLLCLDERGLRVHKLRSAPQDPSGAILAGIATLVGDATGPLEVTHGSTVATNAVLERRGARVALITTAGFEDVLGIGRQTRPELYAFIVRRPEALVEPALIFGVCERLAADGSVLVALDLAEVRALIPLLRAREVESVGVCFLHSYANPAHEQAAAVVLREAGLQVSTSHEVLPEYREYERWSTTAVNAYVAPLMARYLGRLQLGLGAGTLRIMQSNGGAISAARASAEAVQTILSGPAAGVVGAQAVGAASGFSRLITFDMGGTSTDVSLVDGVIGTTSESLVGDLPVRLPVLDIHTVGAGGGSVAWIDAGGGLRVGPRSAGAQPGPVCFGVGKELTVTDAHLLLGRLDPGYFLGGRMTLDLARTEGVARELADRLGLTVAELAEGVVRIANANMERAVRVVSVQRGFDPRDFALLAFGGAGGLHACDLAASLDIETVLIPEHAGVLSALGMLLADVAKDYSASVLCKGSELTEGELRGRLAPLAARAAMDLGEEGFAPDQITLAAALAMRYKGQAFEIDVPLPAAFLDWASPVQLAAVWEDFHQRHARLYGYSNPGRATEAVQLRLRATGRTAKPSIAVATELCGEQATPPPDATRDAVFGGRTLATAVFHRSGLAPGMAGAGPAILVTGESTNIVPPGWRWRLDAAGTLVATRDGDSSPVISDKRSADPVELEIFKNIFVSVAEEMGVTLCRTGFSPNIKERLDYSCAIYDGAGHTIAQGDHLPVHLGAMPLSVRAAIEDGPLEPGDTVILNDPFRGGTHLPDITLVSPVFLPGSEPGARPVFFVANRAHHSDVGGMSPGSMPLAREIFQEGLILPPVKLIKRGVINRDILALILANVRTPEEREGDLTAQIAANRIGEARLLRLVDRYGLATVEQHAVAVQDYAERVLRRTIAAIPDGRYEFADALDDDGFAEEPVHIRCALTIEGDAATVDFTGSDAQTSGGVNANYAITLSATLYCFRCLVEEDVLYNDGMQRPVRVIAPAGTVVNAQHPSAVAGGNVECSQRITDVVLGALAKALPGRIPAASQGTMNNVTLGGRDTRGLPFAYYETAGGGMGGRNGLRGLSGVHTHMSNTRNTPVEALEQALPVRIGGYSLRKGSGGAGAFPGGEGLVREYVALVPMEATILSDRRKSCPYGAQGGLPGGAGRNTLIRADGSVEELPGKVRLQLGAGDRLRIETPGGGGFGTAVSGGDGAET